MVIPREVATNRAAEISKPWDSQPATHGEAELGSQPWQLVRFESLPTFAMDRSGSHGVCASLLSLVLPVSMQQSFS